ncbi:MAG: FAD-binding oxidoreductase [Candidatus Sumerlaeaceae bacterium]|nr:FAD-binding oxidoreductase [Candidatus Sumerlaeaceae bacterium]
MGSEWKKTNEEIVADLQTILGKDQVLHKRIDLEARAGDASIYRLVPRVVVLPRNEDDVAAILQYCRQHQLYLTFRAAGTSLSGQAVTDGILVDVATHWRGIRILEDGRKVAVQPGVIGARVNEMLAPYNRKIGPDPASINACMVGGIAANNASGMCCDVAGNSYHTMASMRLMLADGYVLDTTEPDADEKFRVGRPEIYEGLQSIRRDILSKPELAERICQKFTIKNTCGYSLNAFVDFEKPADILAHLLIGSEGTLGFISEITYHTVPEHAKKATALVFFQEFVDAHRSVKPLADVGAAVVEIMDSAAMRSVEHEMEYGFEVLPQMGALLVEFQAPSEEELSAQVAQAERILSDFPLLRPLQFTRDATQRERYWHMRKGLFPSVGAMRKSGTAVIIEDVCVRPEQLAECALDLQRIFAKHSFPDTIIFGHAKAGNLHFVICTDFADATQRENYARLMDDVVELIVHKYDGSLKGEHGTGRNVAPFVETEWGSDLYAIMWRVKRLLDPEGVLNPGVVLNEDKQVHLKALKTMPAVSPTVDKCIECGYCESKCPSRYLTLTPRQRIALLRQVRWLKENGEKSEGVNLAQELEQAYDYHGLATCATDGLCATACPVSIDTGELVKQLRALKHGFLERTAAQWIASHFRAATYGVRFSLAAAKIGGSTTERLTRMFAHLLHRWTRGALPDLPDQIPLPSPAKRVRSTPAAGEAAQSLVYLPSCLTRTMGFLPGEQASVGLAEATMAVLRACGYEPFIPRGMAHYCCGQPFISKGFPHVAKEMAERMVDFLWDVSVGGTYPIVCDTSPCSGTIALTYGKLLEGDYYRRWRSLRIYDFPVFMAECVLPSRTSWPRVRGTAIVHPTCTLIKLGGVAALRTVAETFCERVYLPLDAGCCGFAGDRGFLVPELTASATLLESQEIRNVEGKVPGPVRYYSTSRTCEIGMSAATQRVYQSLVYLCYEALCNQTG